MDSLAKGKTITYGIERNATCIGSHLRYKKDGIKFTCKCYDEVFDIFLPMIGEHNVYDAFGPAVQAQLSARRPEGRLGHAVPRGDWRMPSDACNTLWMAELEKLEV